MTTREKFQHIRTTRKVLMSLSLLCPWLTDEGESLTSTRIGTYHYHSDHSRYHNDNTERQYQYQTQAYLQLQTNVCMCMYICVYACLCERYNTRFPCLMRNYDTIV